MVTDQRGNGRLVGSKWEIGSGRVMKKYWGAGGALVQEKVKRTKEANIFLALV